MGTLAHSETYGGLSIPSLTDRVPQYFTAEMVCDRRLRDPLERVTRRQSDAAAATVVGQPTANESFMTG